MSQQKVAFQTPLVGEGFVSTPSVHIKIIVTIERDVDHIASYTIAVVCRYYLE